MANRTAQSAAATLPAHLAPVLAIVAVALTLVAVADPDCPPGFDCNSYFGMAADPSALSSFPPHHAARVLPSLVAHALGRTGLSIPDAFRVLSVLGYLVVPLATYAALRRSADPLPALAAVSWLWLAPWPMLYALWDPGQAGYLWALVALLGIWSTAERDRPGATALLGITGALCRQEVVIGAALALAAIACRRRRLLPLVYAGAIVSAVFLLHVAIAASAPAVIDRGVRAFSLAAMVRVWMHPSVVVPVLALAPAAVAAWLAEDLRLRRTSWVGAYLAAVLVLDTSIVAIAGAENFGRIMLLGLWPAWLVGARSLARRDLRSWQWAAIAALPLGYVGASGALRLLAAVRLPVPDHDVAILVYGLSAPLIATALSWRSAGEGAAFTAPAP